MTLTEVSNIITEHLRLIDGGTSVFDFTTKLEHDIHENVYPEYKFLDECNDFPIVCFYILETTYSHIGAGVRYATSLIHLRGYVYEDESQTRAEELLNDIDHALLHLRRLQPCFSDCRTLQLSTDAGFMDPYGVAEILFSVTYLQE